MSRPSAPQIITLRPVPRWACELAGRELERVAVWATADAGVWLRGAAEGDGLALQLTDRPDGVLRCYRVTRDAAGGSVRRPAVRPSRWIEVERFVDRVRWVAALDDGATAAARYTPSARERLFGRACAHLARIGLDGEVGRCERDEQPSEDDPILRGVGIYLDVLAGRWDRVFTAVDVPAWSGPALLGLRGDVEAVRAFADGSPWAGQGALANVMGMAFERVGCDDAAWVAYGVGAQSVLGAERIDLFLELSKLCRVRGDAQGSITWARRALLSGTPTDEALLRACEELVSSGALEDAFTVLRDRSTGERVDAGVALALAELLVWAGRTDEARSWLERVQGSSAGSLRWLRCMGALLALEQRWPEALEVLSRAESLGPRDMEVAAWLSEVHLGIGDRAEAERHLAISRAGAQSAIHVALTAAVRGGDRTELALLLEGLGEPAMEPEHDPATVARALLASFGGNRGELLTRRREPPGDGLGIELVRPPARGFALASRAASAAVLRRVGTAPFSVLEEELEALSLAHPASPHPLCYWAELNLWLGRYERAIELCDRALSRERARWAYVGKAAAMILRGEYDHADLELAECARFFAPLAGATTDVYLGEAHRRRGDYARALEHLGRAVEAKPGRVAAWMNLALAHLALGAREDAERIFERLVARLPGLHWDAWHARSGQRAWPIPRSELAGLFETALELMRGNRSSHTITYFDGSGALRVAQSVDRWREPLARHARFIAMELRTRLVAGIDD